MRADAAAWEKPHVNLPRSPNDLTPALMIDLIGDFRPRTVVSAVEVLDSRMFGKDTVSTSGRATIKVDYAAGSGAGMPTQYVVKMARVLDEICAPFYANEVAFYSKLRPQLAIEAPRVFGCRYDPESLLFAIVLEDLSQSEATFPSVMTPVSVDQVRGLLDTLARLHARFWDSAELATGLSWLETHLHGGVAEHMNEFVPPHIRNEIETSQIKREMVQRLGWTADELYAGVAALQRHQDGLPQTVLHGDTHIGNTYLLPGDRGGLLDWQLMVRGPAIHDVAYLITTALPVAERRKHERDLLIWYLDRLAAHGAAAPGFEEMWLEHRRAMIWGVYIGWLTTPATHYGVEITTLNLLRTMAAFEDHDTGALIRALG